MQKSRRIHVEKNTAAPPNPAIPKACKILQNSTTTQG